MRRKVGRGPDEAADDLDSMGIGGEVRDAVEEDDAPDLFAVWPENRSTVDLFTNACRTQWSVGFEGVIGMNYAGVDVVLRMQRVKRQARVFSDIQVMERAALPILKVRSDE